MRPTGTSKHAPKLEMGKANIPPDIHSPEPEKAVGGGKGDL
jgi:hypothetical protein